MAEWLQNALQEELNDVEQANLREMTRQYEQAALLQKAWWKQNRWRVAAASTPGAASVRRTTGRVLPGTCMRSSNWAAKRRRSRAAAKGGSRYDALLDIFEPDMTSARLDVLFADPKILASFATGEGG